MPLEVYALTDSLVYNIPTRMIDAYHGQSVILRSSDPTELVDCLARADLAKIQFVQLLSAFADTSVLEGVAERLPLEIVFRDASQFQQLYKFVNLLDSHPVRIAISVSPGFSKAVKLAISLNFAVKLEFEQPDEALMKEFESVLDLYLHQSSVRQSIEFFQSTLLSFYRNEPVSLWDIEEENPAVVRYITDDGEETISRRFIGVKLNDSINNFVESFGLRLINEKRECHDCEFFSRCGGYFKWPDPTYSCEGVKGLFRSLKNAAAEVHKDLESYEVMGVHV